MSITINALARRAAEQWRGVDAADVAHLLRELPELSSLTDTQKLQHLAPLCQRLSQSEPLAYVLGTQPFGALPRAVLCTPPTLIPRTETEFWCEWLGARLAASPSWAPHTSATVIVAPASKPFASPSLPSPPRPPPHRRHRILDLCSGTGCIALSLAHRLPCGVDVLAVDISRRAAILGERNRRHILPHLPTLVPHTGAICAAGCGKLSSSIDSAPTLDGALSAWLAHTRSAPPEAASTVTFVQGDVFDENAARMIGASASKFDLLVSNPPYIDDALFATLPASVRQFEDSRALVAPDRGCALIRRVLQWATTVVQPLCDPNSLCPSVCIEYGGNEQTGDVRTLIATEFQSLHNVAFHRDQFECDRFFTCTL